MTTLELCRSVPFAVTRDGAEPDADGLTLDGIATMIGRDLKAGEEPSEAAGWTFIDSWEGQFWERFKPGSFRKTLRERIPMMQYDHGRHPLIGSLPIGTYSLLEENDEGLHVVGRLTDNWLIQPVRDAIAVDPATGRSGIQGMSIRFSPVKDEWHDNAGKAVKADELMDLLWSPGERGPLRRSVAEAKLLEAGPVAWPAYPQTSVGVRAQQAAAEIRSNKPLVRDMLAALATGRHSAVESTLRDLGIELDEAARALLIEPVSEESPEETLEADVAKTDAAAIRDTDIDSEPPTGALPAGTTPEPPPALGRTSEPSTENEPPAGHSSHEMSDQEARQHKARLNYLTLNRVGKYKG